MLVSVFSERDPIFLDQKEKHQCKLITGKETNVSKCSGYCACQTHPGYLNKKIMDKHQCIEKECDWLFKIVNSFDRPKWKGNEKIGEVIEQYFMDQESRMKACERTLDKYEGMKITELFRNERGEWCVKYVSICSLNVEGITKILQDILHGSVNLIRNNCDFDSAMNLIYGEIY